MRMVSIASGSSGNCIYIGSDSTHLLVDAGISNKRIQQGLNEIGLTGNDVNGILITHEHSDHIKGLGVLSRKYEIPIYGTRETLDEIAAAGSLGKFDKGLLTPVSPDLDFMVGDLTVKPFKIDHDAANPVAYRVQNGEKSVAVATDMGHFDQYIIDHLQGLDALLLESNHDVNMLQAGPYPYYLKRRILGDHGHLSNENAGRLLCCILHNENAGRLLNCVLHDRLKKILLGHLSKENNYEELAYETVRLEIDEGDCPYGASDFSISVASRDCMSEIIYL